jgi:hypothetical protein
MQTHASTLTSTCTTAHVQMSCMHHLPRVHPLLLRLVCRENLYEFGRFVRESGQEPYFTLPRLKKVMRQVRTRVAVVVLLCRVHTCIPCGAYVHTLDVPAFILMMIRTYVHTDMHVVFAFHLSACASGAGGARVHPLAQPHPLRHKGSSPVTCLFASWCPHRTRLPRLL